MENEQARYWACIVLGDIGPDAAEAVPEVTKVLEDKDPDVRLQALLTLGEIGQASAPAVPKIVQLFQNDEFTNVRYAAAYALGKIRAKGDAEAVLSKAMESDDEFLRTISAWALALTNPEDTALVDRAVRLIVQAFESDDVNVRRAAARAVIEFDVDRDVVGPLLVAALKDKDKTVVGNAVEALADMGPAALQHVDDALENRELRHLALLLIARMGPEAASAVGALVDAIGKAPQDEDDLEFVREAQIALGAIGPGASQAVSALVDSLSSDQDEIRTSAAYALGRIGPAASAAVPKLRDSLRSQDEATKLTSILALLQIQPGQRALLANSAGPMLLQALENDNMLIRAEAAGAIAEFGQASATVRKRATPLLKRLLKDDSELVRNAAEAALKKLGGG
jgi:HEAT repeat protein